MIPWIIEAPLNSVEVFEAILQPSFPFEIHTACHFHRPGVTKRGAKVDVKYYDPLPKRQALYREYARLQGRLEQAREISYICIPSSALELIRNKLGNTFWPVALQYITIPWASPRLFTPWALVLLNTLTSVFPHTYEYRVSALLERLGLEDCDFQRSLLRPGTTPLPENLQDYYRGIPGKAGLSYYRGTTDGGSDEMSPMSGCEEVRDAADTTQGPQHPEIHPTPYPIKCWRDADVEKENAEKKEEAESLVALMEM